MYMHYILANVHIGMGEYIHTFLLQQRPLYLGQDLIENNRLKK